MKLSTAHKMVKQAVKSDVVPMLWGPPGIGKSSIVHQIAKELLRKVIDLRLAQLEPTDLRGVPIPVHSTGRASWYLPEFWPEAARKDCTREIVGKDGEIELVKVKAGDGIDGPGIIFLDEIEKAPISVKNASLQFVLDRMVGTYKLPNDWAIVCAGNREEDGCFSQPLGAALSNRMIHLEVDADVETWSTWARDSDVVEDIIGFLHFRPDLLYKQTDGHAFPTPRSWVIASKLIDGVSNTKEQKELLESSVGKGTAQEFRVWQEVYRNVDPEAVFRGEIPNFDGQDQSFKYAVALAVAFHLRKRKNKIKGIEDNLAKFLEKLSAELRVVLLRQQSLNTLEAMVNHDAFKALAKEMMKIMV